MKEGEYMDNTFNEVFANRLHYYMDLHGMTQKDLAEKMGVSEASASNWLKGIKIPRADKVDKMCSIFNCTRSDLVEMPTTKLSDRQAELERLIMSLDDMQVQAALNFVDYLHKLENNSDDQ